MRHELRMLCTCAAMLSAAAIARGDTIIPVSSYGKGIDTSFPLDGIADEVTVSTSTVDLERNASDLKDPGSVVEDRGQYEFSLGSVAGQTITSAHLEFEVFGPPSEHATLFYVYSGNGLLETTDFARISTLAATATLGEGVVSVNVTSAVQSRIAANAGYAGFVVRLSTEDQLLSIWNPGFSNFAPRLRVVVLPECAGDANGDNAINGADLSVLLSQFGTTVPAGTGADFNGDGIVNGADLSVLLGAFGTSC